MVPLELVANSVRTFPKSWLTASRTDVTDDFTSYARPLIGETWPVSRCGGIQRFTRFDPNLCQQKAREIHTAGLLIPISPCKYDGTHYPHM